MCEHLSPNHNLSYALTAGLPAKLSWVRRQAGGCPRSSAMKIFYVKIIRGAVVKQFDRYWFKNCASLIWIWRQSEYVGDPSQMRRGPTGTDRRMLSVPTGVHVAGRSAGYENQALSSLRFCFSTDLWVSWGRSSFRVFCNAEFCEDVKFVWMSSQRCWRGIVFLSAW